MAQFIFILWGHYGHIGYMAQAGYVKHTVMRGAVSAYYPCPVNGHNYRKVLQADIVQYFIVGPLQKSGIYGNYRYKSFLCKACRKGQGMLFCRSEEHTSELQSQSNLV